MEELARSAAGWFHSWSGRSLFVLRSVLNNITKPEHEEVPGKESAATLRGPIELLANRKYNRLKTSWSAPRAGRPFQCENTEECWRHFLYSPVRDRSCSCKQTRPMKR